MTVILQTLWSRTSGARDCFLQMGIRQIPTVWRVFGIIICINRHDPNTISEQYISIHIDDIPSWTMWPRDTKYHYSSHWMPFVAILQVTNSSVYPQISEIETWSLGKTHCSIRSRLILSERKAQCISTAEWHLKHIDDRTARSTQWVYGEQNREKESKWPIHSQSVRSESHRKVVYVTVMMVMRQRQDWKERERIKRT